jgi:hypothetical protein
VTSTLALRISVQPYSAALPWTLAMAIAVISVRERTRSA